MKLRSLARSLDFKALKFSRAENEDDRSRGGAGGGKNGGRNKGLFPRDSRRHRSTLSRTPWTRYRFVLSRIVPSFNPSPDRDDARVSKIMKFRRSNARRSRATYRPLYAHLQRHVFRPCFHIVGHPSRFSDFSSFFSLLFFCFLSFPAARYTSSNVRCQLNTRRHWVDAIF